MYIGRCVCVFEPGAPLSLIAHLSQISNKGTICCSDLSDNAEITERGVGLRGEHSVIVQVS